MSRAHVTDVIPRLFIPVPRELRTRANPREKSEYCPAIRAETTSSVLVEILYNAGIVQGPGDSFNELCTKVKHHKNHLDMSYLPPGRNSWSMGKRGLLSDIANLKAFVNRFPVLGSHAGAISAIETQVKEMTDREVTFKDPNQPGRDALIKETQDEILEMQILMTPGLSTGELSNRYIKLKAELLQRIRDVNNETWLTLKNNAMALGAVGVLSSSASKRVFSSLLGFGSKGTSEKASSD